MSLNIGVGNFFALDVGTDALRMVELSKTGQGWALEHFAYVQVSRQILQDSSDAGRRRLGETIKQAAEQAGIKTKKIAIGLPSSKTFTTIIEIPTQDAKSMDKIIKYHEDQYIPMPIDDATIVMNVRLNLAMRLRPESLMAVHQDILAFSSVSAKDEALLRYSLASSSGV